MPKLSAEVKEARRQSILEAARRCFAEYGYEGATVTRLEAATGLSRGAIFNYFTSKDELFLALADADAERFARRWLEGGFEEVLRGLLAEDPAWMGVYFEIGRRLRAPELEQQLEVRIQELQASGELRDDVGWRTLGRFMSIVADGLAIRHTAGFDTADAEALIMIAAGAVRPVGQPPSSRPYARA